MLDLGRPLHAYYPARLSGDLVIRLARRGASYQALNGRTYALDADMLVIGDDHGPDDLAGVMGGERSGVSEATTDMFLDVAIFDPTSVAATCRQPGLQSAARYLSERGPAQHSLLRGAEVEIRKASRDARVGPCV